MTGQTVTLNGRDYLVDYGSNLYRRSSIPLLRRQADSSEQPGSQSINPEGPWRRTFESWHHGDAQTHFDRSTSDSYRFEDSAGVDPWTRSVLTLLPTSVRTYTPTTGITSTVVSGNSLFFTDGTAVKQIASVSTDPVVTALTGLYSPAVAAGKLSTDGAYVYIPQGSHGLYRVASNALGAALYNSTAATDSYHALGRLITTNGLTISNVTDAVTSTVLATLPAGRWTDVAEGKRYIYAAASNQSDSTVIGSGTVYKIGILADGTGLDVPAIACRLPAGEDVKSVFGYLGYVLIGTTKGVRFAVEESDGSLTLGALRRVGFDENGGDGGVLDFTAEDRFVWFTKNGIGPDSGLGRLDLSEFIAPLTPAGANDLQISSMDPNGSDQIIINNTGWLSANIAGTRVNRRFFVVQGAGTYAGIWFEDSYRVSTATWYSGTIDYGLNEPKLPLYLDLQMLPLPANATVSVALAINGGSYVTVGSTSTDGVTGLTCDLSGQGGSAARYCQIRVTITMSSSSLPVPEITRVTLRAFPVSGRGEQIELPIVLSETTSVDGTDTYVDISGEISNIRAMIAADELVDLVEGDVTTSVYVEDFDFRAHHATLDGDDTNGLLILKLKTFAA